MTTITLTEIPTLDAAPDETTVYRLPDFGRGDDRIDLAAFDGIDSLADLSLSQTDRGLIIDLSGHGGDTLTLEGYHQPDALSDADFIF